MKNLEKYLSILDGEVDGLLLTSRYSRHYGAEFDIAEGVAIVTKNGCRYFTDSRYIESAENGIQGFEVLEVNRENPYSKRLNDAIADFGVTDCNRIISLTAGNRICCVVLVVTAVGAKSIDARLTAIQILDGEEAGVLDHLAQLRVHLVANTIEYKVRGLSFQTFHGIHQRDIFLIFKFNRQTVGS